MNKELILLLAQEAAEYCKTQPRDMWLLWEQKFAELIVDECIDIIIDSDPSPKMIVNEPYHTMIENIKQHFGWYEE